MASFEMDFVFDGDFSKLEAELDEFKNKHGLTEIKVLNERGMGGGWPIIKVTGLIECVLGMIDAEKIDDTLNLEASPAEIRAAIRAGKIIV